MSPSPELLLRKPSEEPVSVRKQEIDQLICDWVSDSSRHSCAAEEKAFREMINFLDPSYVIPSAVEISERINADFFEIRSKELRMLKDACRLRKMSLSTYFTSNTKRCLVLNAHVIIDCWRVKTVTLDSLSVVSRPNLTGENVAKWINDKLWNFHIASDAILAIVHCHNNIIQDGVRKLTEMNGWHSILCCQSVLCKVTSELCQNIFVSKRFAKLNDPIHFFTDSILGKNIRNQFGKLRDDVNLVGSKRTTEDQSKNVKGDFEDVHTLVKVLNPLDAALSGLNKRKFIPCSFLPVFLSDLENKLSAKLNMLEQFNETENIDTNNIPSNDPVTLEKNFTSKLLEALQKCTAFDVKDVVTIAAALDPRYKKLSFMKTAEKEAVYERICSCSDLEEVHHLKALKASFRLNDPLNVRLRDIVIRGVQKPSKKTDESIRSELSNLIKAEMKIYLAESSPGGQICPLKWWKSNQWKYPVMSLLARSYLTIPAIAGSFNFGKNEALLTSICSHVPLCDTDKSFVLL